MTCKSKKLKNGQKVWEVRGRQFGVAGKQVRRRFERKRDAEEFLDELRRHQRDRQKGLVGGPSFLETTFRTESEAWLSDLTIRASKSWLHTCEKNLADFNDQYGHLTLDKITTDFLNRVQQSLKKRRSPRGQVLRNATVNRYTEAIIATLNFSVKSGRIPFHPAANFKKLPRNSPETLFWDKTEAQSFLLWADQFYNNWDLEDRCTGRQYYLIYSLLLHGALRPSEAWGLRPYDLMPAQPGEATTLFVRRQFNTKERDFGPLKCERNSKHSKARHIPCPTTLRHELQKWVEDNDISSEQTIFQGYCGKPIEHRRLAARFQRDLKAWGGRPIRLYDLRYTAATLMLAGGVDVRTLQAILGHSNIESTMVYAHLVGDRVKQVGQQHVLTN